LPVALKVPVCIPNPISEALLYQVIAFMLYNSEVETTKPCYGGQHEHRRKRDID
jgi:hypothetical protein